MHSTKSAPLFMFLNCFIYFFFEILACLEKPLQIESIRVKLKYVQCYKGELSIPELDICGEGTMSHSSQLSLFERRVWENWMGLQRANMGEGGYVMFESIYVNLSIDAKAV